MDDDYFDCKVRKSQIEPYSEEDAEFVGMVPERYEMKLYELNQKIMRERDRK